LIATLAATGFSAATRMSSSSIFVAASCLAS
jgi:hypothetical protein